MHTSATVRTAGASITAAAAAARAAPVQRIGGALMVAAVMAVSACSATGADPAPSSTTSTTSTATASSASGPAAGYDAATVDDAEFNAEFSHEFADVDGVKMHYVTGGSGPPLVLLHGWPQSWFEWREIMPALAQEHTVYALDLPGLGDSEGEPSGYDKATLARYVHGLVSDELGLDEIDLVGHDLGAGVGYQYAAQFPDEVTGYANLDFVPPSEAFTAATIRAATWHVAFHSQPGIPEMLVDDDVRDYLAAFYQSYALNGAGTGGAGADQPLTDTQIEEFARTYQRPQVLSGGFDLYRAFDQDEQDNTAVAPIEVPTMLMTASGLLEPIRAGAEPLFSNLERAVEVPGSGHWLAEENPEFVTAELLAFFATSR